MTRAWGIAYPPKAHETFASIMQRSLDAFASAEARHSARCTNRSAAFENGFVMLRCDLVTA